MTSTTVWQEVNPGLHTWIGITVTQFDQDYKRNNSKVIVEGLVQSRASNNPTYWLPHVNSWFTGSGSTFTLDGEIVSLSPATGESQVLILHEFTMLHDSLGFRTVNFTYNMGAGGGNGFPNGSQVSASLVLDRIPVVPTKPGSPTFTHIFQDKLGVSWTPPIDDGGSSIDNYSLRRYDGPSATGPYLINDGASLSRNIDGLDPGKTYTFTVVAHNASRHGDSGYSPPSDPATVTLYAGAWIRHNGVWRKAIPFVRHNGKWRQAIPYVRSSGVWKRTG